MTYSKKTRLVEGSPIDGGSKFVLSQEVKTQGVQVESCRQKYTHSPFTLFSTFFLSLTFLTFPSFINLYVIPIP